MPISLQQFNEGLDPSDVELLTKFEQEPYRAYSLEDVMSQSDDLFGLKPRLDRLVDDGMLRAKTVGGTLYYVSAKASSVIAGSMED